MVVEPDCLASPVPAQILPTIGGLAVAELASTTTMASSRGRGQDSPNAQPDGPEQMLLEPRVIPDILAVTERGVDREGAMKVRSSSS